MTGSPASRSLFQLLIQEAVCHAGLQLIGLEYLGVSSYATKLRPSAVAVAPIHFHAGGLALIARAAVDAIFLFFCLSSAAATAAMLHCFIFAHSRYINWITIAHLPLPYQGSPFLSEVIFISLLQTCACVLLARATCRSQCSNFNTSNAAPISCSINSPSWRLRQLHIICACNMHACWGLVCICSWIPLVPTWPRSRWL